MVLDSWVLPAAFACHAKFQPAVTGGGTISSICNKMAIKRLWEVLLPGLVETFADVLMKVLIKVLLVLSFQALRYFLLFSKARRRGIKELPQ